MTYEQSQFWIKFIITLVVGVPVVLLLIKLWQRDVDVARFINVPKTLEESANKAIGWIPEREKEALYQGGKIVSKIRGEAVDEENSLITFEEVYESNSLNLDKEFEFRKWVLKVEAIDSLIGFSTSEPQKGRILQGVKCKITGQR